MFAELVSIPNGLSKYNQSYLLSYLGLTGCGVSLAYAFSKWRTVFS